MVVWSAIVKLCISVHSMGRTSHKQGPTIYSLQVGEGYERVVKVVKMVKITHQVYLEVWWCSTYISSDQSILLCFLGIW